MQSKIELAKKYKFDDKELLKYHPSLENLYLFSKQALGLFENIEFDKKDKILFVGNLNIASQKYILDKVDTLVYFDSKNKYKDLLDVYFSDEAKFKYVNKLIDISNERFDKIFLISALDTSYKRSIREYKSLLTKDGNFIIAINNIYGVKELLGNKDDEFKISFFDLKNLIKDMNFSDTTIYYPFPSYKLPLSIFSDEYINKDELLNELVAYDYPTCSIRSPKDLYCDIVENGDFSKFASSFLLVTNNSYKEIFVKYNRNRKNNYAIKTCIILDSQKRKVRKSILEEEAKEHIKKFEASYKILQKENKNILYLKPYISDDNSYVDFDYVEGELLSDLILRKIKNKKLDLVHIENILEKIIGEGTHNIDTNFDNFIVKNNQIFALDYEWVADEILDKKFSYYRTLSSFYNKYKNHFENSLEEILAYFDIDKEDIDKFNIKENEFQDSIRGENQEIYLDNYFVDFKYGKELENILEDYKDYEKLKEENLAHHNLVANLMESNLLSENHIFNLEHIIEELRKENSALVAFNNKLIKYFITYRIYRKIKNILIKRFPQNTRIRNLLSLLKHNIKNPFYLVSLIFNSKERFNFFACINIGRDYLLHGRLRFEKYDNPTLSIIIPVYNQVHYTYACLASILKNTKNLSYEIIIADDVSSDATKDLSKYVDNIVISRNSTNQGFLKNCNNAAKKARGKYILFLNNDTVVNEDCFLNLIKLYESSDDIGLVGAKFVYPDNRLQEAGGIIWNDASAWNYGRYDNPDKAKYNYVKDVDYISGACIMLSKKLWENIGAFDERYAPAYCEDSDLCFEVRKRGLRVVYQPKSVVTHYEGISNGTDVNGSGLKKYQIENTQKLKEKWKLELKEQYSNGEEVFRARERSKNKKIILFIDHYVPTFDKDAGSKTTYQYLKMLVKKSYIVKFIGDNFIKDEPYTTALENLGIEVLYGRDLQINIFNWIKEHEKDIHLVYLNRPHISYKYINFLKNHTNLKLIYYGHDLHFLRESREFELTKDKTHKFNSQYFKNMELDILKKVDMAYYPSVVECNYLKTINKDFKLKAITAYVYEEFAENINRDFSTRKDIIFVGGFAHKPNIDAVLYFINEIWSLVREKIDANFYIVGSQATKEIKDLHNPKQGIIFKGFVTEEELQNLYKNVKIVVAPLRFGAGVKGKIIEALYYNTPIITTSVGAEGISLADEIMCIKDEALDFAKAIINLYNDNQKLAQMSKKADEYIRQYHSIEAAWNIIKEDFE